MRQQARRGFQSVREIARLRDRAAYSAFVVIEERVEIRDERLHLCRVPS